MESSITAQLATISAEGIKETQLVNLSYWFGNPGSLVFEKQLVLIGLSILLLVLSALFFALAKKKGASPPQSKFFNKVAWYLLGFSLFGAMLVLVRFWGIPFLSVRLGWLVWLSTILFFSFPLFKFYTEKLTSQNLQYQSYLTKKKYLPTKKKKK